MGRVLARATSRTTLGHIRHVAAVPMNGATGLVEQVYRQVVRDFGLLAPPVVLHAPAPELLAASWLMLRESLLADIVVDRDVKEAVATAVSLSNRCPYCVEVHAATLTGLSGDGAAAVAAGDIDAVAQPGLREVVQWARDSATGQRDGARRPYPDTHAPELIGVAVTFHYLNRMVNVFLTESPYPQELLVKAPRNMRWLAAQVMRRLASGSRTPGACLDLLAEATLPADLSWAGGQSSIAEAFARAAAAIDAGGQRVVPEGVQRLVSARLSGWTGVPPGIRSRAWLDEAVDDLPVIERPAGRLALVTALASYQITEPVIDEFRRTNPSDEALLEITAWASMAAAREIGRRLGR